MNHLYFGDNLGWLRNRKEFPDASVDLVYLDPPFNSNADYNVLFREPSGEVSQAQFHAFTDTWSWADAAALGVIAHRGRARRRRDYSKGDRYTWNQS
jgi:site-specific DNA-methyltransferase (adenine-specific)